MTRARVFAGAAALLTALLLQATLVGPLAMLVPVSLPAILVAAVALGNGPATGISFGFTVGLVADLASSHPAGVLALTWLGLGLVCGLAADRRTVIGDAAVAAVACTVASFFATVLLIVVHAGGATVWLAVRTAVPAGLGDALLALAVVPLVRAALRTDRLRAPRVLTGQLGVGSARG
jgi:cell shape-determining protein MreD